MTAAVSEGLDTFEALGPGGPPRRVIILGAGMAGLVAADALVRAGHEPLVIEARSRVGGRIWTLRDGLAPGLYAEMGAMRIPQSHRHTLSLVERFHLETRPFTMGNPNGLAYLEGARVRLRDLPAYAQQQHPHRNNGDGDGWVVERWERVLAPLRADLAARGAAAWRDLDRYDALSLVAFLQSLGWSEREIEQLGVVHNLESQLHVAALEVLREELGDCYRHLVYVEGGTDRLPHALAATLGNRMHLGTQVVALEQDAQGVTVHCRRGTFPWSVSGDYAIITLPFPALRHVDVLQPFSAGKQRAIRQLHYDAATKIALQYGRRFWEDEEGIYGGHTVTDLPIRMLYYPDHGRETGRGVLLASYTWGLDADRWASLPHEERIRRAAEDVARIHPQAPQHLEGGVSYAWRHDPYAGGAFALFAPGQQADLHGHVIAPEGRYHFAGEHASLMHGWIEGAVDSGLRAASEVVARAAAEADRIAARQSQPA